MKKYILILSLMLIAVVLLAQTDTVIVEDDADADIPDWISYAINAVLIAVSAWLTKAKVRLAKAVTLLETLSQAAERGTVSTPDIQNVITQAKDLVAKEK